MNKDAEAWIEKYCDGHLESLIVRAAMEWAYADAAKVCRAADDRMGMADGADGYFCAAMIEERMA